MFAIGYEILFLFLVRRGHDQLAVAADQPAEGDGAVDLGNDGRLLRPPRLEQLSDAGQTAGNIAGLGALARYFYQNLPGLDVFAVIDQQTGSDRNNVGTGSVLLALDLDLRAERTVALLDDATGAHARGFVELLAHRHPFYDIDKFDLAGAVGEYDVGVGIPLVERLSGFDLFPIADLQYRAIRGIHAGPDPVLLIEQLDLAVAADDRGTGGGVFHRIDVDEVDQPSAAGGDLRLLSNTAGGAADVEGAQGQLGAGLADTLGGDHANRLADVDHPPAGHIAAVAVDAHTALRLAGQHRADQHLLDAGLCDAVGILFLQ